jgi:cellulose synthase/poly-beta-1,6-N-acetylglucosamine synthase-like glycosyltransferase
MLYALIISFVGLQLLVVLAPMLRFARCFRRAPPSRTDQPEATVILPCKGIDVALVETVRRLLRQDYNNYGLLFVTESEEDPAHKLIKDLIEGASPPARLIIAGPAAACGQKVHNLTTAVDALDELFPRTEIIAFCDSDAQPQTDWLANLVAGLADPEVGVATGYRWYLPAGSGLGSLLLSAWNAQSLFLFGDESSFAWGGTMAMRRVDFEQLEIRQRWRGGVSDDGSVTTAVRSHGRRIQFVPRCLVASRGDASLSDVLEFTNRQIILTRVYMPRAWREIAALTLYFCALFLLVASLLYRAFAQQGLPDGVVSLLLPGTAFAVVLQCWLQTTFAMRILPQHRDELRRLRWAYLGVMPLVAPLALCNVIVSCFSRRIVWRGIGYELLGPNQTVIWKRDLPDPRAI